MSTPLRRPMLGFTILELIIAFALLAVVTAFAVPSFQTFIARNRVKSASEQLQSALFYIRSEALKRNQTVTLTCNAGGCQQGWVITSGASATQLAVQGPFNDSRLNVSGTASSVSLNRNGRAAAIAAFTVSRTDAGQQRCVRLYLSGLSDVRDSGC